MNNKPQAQYSTQQQLQELMELAHQNGLYDAADAIRPLLVVRPDRFQVLETGDTKGETLLDLPLLTEENAKKVVDLLNVVCPSPAFNKRFWRVVEHGYTPEPEKV